MSALTDMAKDKYCQIRLPGVCNGNKATTVFAHYRNSQNAGIAIKPNDLIGSWACSSCHHAVDGRLTTKYSKAELETAHLQGMARTIKEITDDYKIILKIKPNRKGMF